jgi:anti-sigma factor RsiW
MSDSELQNRRRAGDPPRETLWHNAHAEARLLEYLDGVLPPLEASAVEAHLAVCPECQALAEQWRRVDFELCAHLKRPTLAAAFRVQVWRKIGTDPSRAPARNPAQLQEEWSANWSDYRRRFLRAHFPALLDCLGYGVATAIAGYLLFRLSTPLVSLWAQVTTNPMQPWVLPLGFGMAALSLIGAFGLATKRTLKRWLGAL